MLNATFRPLHQWTGLRTKDRKQAQFKATWLQTLDLLEYELNKLQAHHVVIQIEDPETHKRMRNDGSITLPDKFWREKPGVILNFESPKGNISMPCDRYPWWRDNLRAIALSLEALRAVDRYGVTKGNEQYIGWAQLPAASDKMDKRAAAEFLRSLLGVQLDQTTSKASIAEVCKRARIEYHPDQAQDEHAKLHRHEIFVRIGQAEKVLCS